VAGSTQAQAMARALQLARRGPVGPNPRVGCVVLGPGGEPAGEGWHEGAGTPHAEVMALQAAGDRARGGTAVVTLEPCAHQGRTGPCVEALLAAGVARVLYGRPDPDPVAAGGAHRLRTAGVAVAELDPRQEPELRAAVEELVGPWAFAVRHRRPFVTWKFAATLDGRSAARDGSSRWITGPAARADVHARRAECDTVLVGTGTALADDPHLTVRDADDRLAAHQPRRAVMGLRELPAGARVLDDAAPTVLLRTREPAVALGRLWADGARHVWLEGGPRLAAAFLREGLVDEVVTYLAPALLGAGPSAVADLGLPTVADILRLQLVDVAVVGGDVRVRSRSRDLADGRAG
jgi:diaminohydroxyphosphoribosylaminopyrimidine deaminase/5-amino-6-(5-phosphoribosylamino)uracil reductase